MKKDKMIYDLHFCFVILSIVGFLGFIIAGLIVRENENDYLIWFLLAAIFFLLSIVSIYLLMKFFNSQRYKKVSKSIRENNFVKVKKRDHIKIYRLDSEQGNIEQILDRQLSLFKIENTSNGRIFHRTNKSIYNKKEDSFDVFYLFHNDQKNTYDEKTENNRILILAEEMIDFLENRYQKIGFINCVFIFQEDILTENQKEFYYNFTGLWQSQMNHDKFNKNQYFTYCGIDESEKQICFYQTLISDEGNEVDLSYLILNELKIKEKELDKDA